MEANYILYEAFDNFVRHLKVPFILYRIYNNIRKHRKVRYNSDQTYSEFIEHQKVLCIQSVPKFLEDKFSAYLSFLFDINGKLFWMVGWSTKFLFIRRGLQTTVQRYCVWLKCKNLAYFSFAEKIVDNVCFCCLVFDLISLNSFSQIYIKIKFEEKNCLGLREFENSITQ